MMTSINPEFYNITPDPRLRVITFRITIQMEKRELGNQPLVTFLGFYKLSLYSILREIKY
jgi:hypothetical protein